MSNKPAGAPALFCATPLQLDQAHAVHDDLCAHGATPRVLHVDGDHETALVLATLLVPETQVTHAGTLDAAMRAVGSGRFALVVLDPDLPDGDGAALLDLLGEQQRATPVLLYSARQPDRARQAMAFLPKPWTSPRQLWLTVSRLMDIPSLAAEAQPAY